MYVQSYAILRKYRGTPRRSPLVDLLFGLAEVLRGEFDTLAVNKWSTRKQGANGISDVGSNKNRNWECLPRSVPSYIELARYFAFEGAV